MAVVSCPSCHKPMNAQAVVCPHCNARRTDLPTGPAAGKTMSPAEIRAMLALDPTLSALSARSARGTLPALLLPHPSTTGTARTVELVLTLISLPLVLSGALALSLSSRSRTRMRQVGGSEGAAVTLMIAVGSGVLWTVLDLVFHASGTAVVGTLAVTIGALIARAVIRSRATANELD